MARKPKGKPEPAGRDLGAFEAAHGGGRIKALESRLAAEQAKVEALARVQNRVHVETSRECRVVFGMLTDTHFGSLYVNEPALRAYYEYAAGERGVETFLHAGDVLDGHGMYRGQEFELRDVGLTKQIERMRESAPKIGRTLFITGNHDASFKNLVGVNVGEMIADALPDWHFLGEDQARVRFDTPNGRFEVMLLHPGGGTAYALSYRPQKIVEQLAGGTKPAMLAIGHFHKSEYIPNYRNIAVIQGGTMQKQTPFMVRKGLAAHVGGWIVEAMVGKGCLAVRAEFVTFF